MKRKFIQKLKLWHGLSRWGCSWLPQGYMENKRVLAMVRQMGALGFGNCPNQYECEAACPKGVSVDNIAKLNCDHMIVCASEAVVVFS